LHRGTREAPRRRVAVVAIASVLCLVTTSASASRPDTVTLRGTLVMVHEGATMHYFLDVGGRLSRELTFPTTQGLRPGVGLEVTGVGRGDTLAVTTAARMPARAATPSTVGTRTLLVVLVQWSGGFLSTTQAGANAFVFGTTDPLRRSVKQWYEDVSYGQLEWTGDVTPVLTITGPSTCNLTQIANRSDAAATAAGYTPGSYDDRMYDFPAGYCNNSFGEIAGPRSWIEDGLIDPSNPAYDPGDEGYVRMIPDHELGHNLGEYHGHGLDCGADTLTSACIAGASGATECDFAGGAPPCVSEYGDAYDVMGSNWTGEETSSQGVNWFGIQHEMQLGWVSGRTITDNQPATSADHPFTIGPIERSTGDVGLTLHTSAGRTYEVEFRQALGQDAFLSKYPAATSGVQISMVNPVAGFGSDTGLATLDTHPDSDNSTLYADWFDAPLALGQTFTDVGGAFTLSLDAASSTGASVNVHWSEPPGVTALDQMDPSVTYNGWRGVADVAANGGAYRLSRAKNDTVTWTSPATTSIGWITRTGPDQGEASVSIDGVSKGTFDLYAASAVRITKSFLGLAHTAHTISIKVLGTKNAASSGAGVALDAFRVGTASTQESAPAIGYDTWRNTNSVNADGGSYRVASAAPAKVSLSFTGTGIDWVTARGKAYGRATVTIDGVLKGTVDLYAPAQAWKTVIAYAGLGPGTHTLVIQVLGLKDARATATKVVVDGFKVHA
jgi:hypothetical protein